MSAPCPRPASSARSRSDDLQTLYLLRPHKTARRLPPQRSPQGRSLLRLQTVPWPRILEPICGGEAPEARASCPARGPARRTDRPPLTREEALCGLPPGSARYRLPARSRRSGRRERVRRVRADISLDAGGAATRAAATARAPVSIKRRNDDRAGGAR